jgi:hypothetical protein
MHFIQYGTLSILIYRALAHRISDALIFPLTVSICAVVGTLDEIVQWFTPNRFFDYDDIIINAGSAFLMQIGIAFGINPKIINWRINDLSLKYLVNSLSVFLILLGFCFNNTPKFANWYAEKLPFLALAKNNDSVMSDYGYKYQVENIGTFISRFSPEKHLEKDQFYGSEAAKIVKENYHPDYYLEFQKMYLVSNPLAYELRVRLFRRDAHWQKAKEYPEGTPDFNNHILIAYGEHKILNFLFPIAYRESSKMLNQEDQAWMRNYLDNGELYFSTVGSDLLVFFSARQYTLLLISLIVFLRVAYWRFRS